MDTDEEASQFSGGTPVKEDDTPATNGKKAFARKFRSEENTPNDWEDEEAEYYLAEERRTTRKKKKKRGPGIQTEPNSTSPRRV